MPAGGAGCDWSIEAADWGAGADWRCLRRLECQAADWGAGAAERDWGAGAAGEPGPTGDGTAEGAGGVEGAGGAGSAEMSEDDVAASEANEGLAELGATEIPALTKEETEAQAQQAPLTGFAAPYIGPRPSIITRKGWGADESLREKEFGYTTSVKVAFVHHTATGNNYTCAEAPSVLRGIYRYHVVSNGWRDIGYNFAIDKCGNIYEGRAGGVAKPVMGAHTLGFNTDSVGIAVLGTYSSTNPPAAATTSVAKLTAWKLGLYGVNPTGTGHPEVRRQQ